MKKALSHRAAETVVSASHGKLGVASSYVIMPAMEVNALVIERNTPEKLAEPYEKLEVTVTRA